MRRETITQEEVVGADALYETSWRDRADRELQGVVEDVTTGSYDDDYGGDQGSGGGGGICYIATPTRSLPCPYIN